MTRTPDRGWALEAQAALDALAAALERADLEALLASEGRLSDIAARLTQSPLPRPPLDAASLQQIDTMRRTLARCRRLGRSLTDLARLVQAAQTDGFSPDAYGPEGTPRPAPAGAFHTQV